MHTATVNPTTLTNRGCRISPPLGSGCRSGRKWRKGRKKSRAGGHERIRGGWWSVPSTRVLDSWGGGSLRRMRSKRLRNGRENPMLGVAMPISIISQPEDSRFGDELNSLFEEVVFTNFIASVA